MLKKSCDGKKNWQGFCRNFEMSWLFFYPTDHGDRVMVTGKGQVLWEKKWIGVTFCSHGIAENFLGSKAVFVGT